MILHCGLLLLFLSCVRTTQYVHDYGLDNTGTEYNQYSFWPSARNAARILTMRRRDTQELSQPSRNVVSEGGGGPNPNEAPPPVSQQPPAPLKPSTGNQPEAPENKDNARDKGSPVLPAVAGPSNDTVISSPGNVTDGNSTETPPKPIVAVTNPTHLDINSPGATMRAAIVFGAFLVMAVAYFIFYRSNRSKHENSSMHNLNDNNQFRYGVLQSDDRQSLELSRVPLTMESDDDEEEDLEIFDLERKKKSLSYVNLQQNDEDVVFDHTRVENVDRDNLLLDIEEGPSDTLINWTNNSGNKSIL